MSVFIILYFAFLAVTAGLVLAVLVQGLRALNIYIRTHSGAVATAARSGATVDD